MVHFSKLIFSFTSFLSMHFHCKDRVQQVLLTLLALICSALLKNVVAGDWQRWHSTSLARYYRPGQLHLAAIQRGPEQNLTRWEADRAQQLPFLQYCPGLLPQRPMRWALHVAMPVRDRAMNEIREDVEAMGLRLGDYLPHGAFRLDNASLEQAYILMKHHHVMGMTCLPPPSLQLKRAGELMPFQSVRVIVHSSPNEGILKAFDDLEAIRSTENIWYFETLEKEAMQISNALSEHGAHHIEIRPKFRALNRYAKYIIQSGHHQKLPMFNHRLDGRDSIVNIADTGMDFDMCFFKDSDREVPVGRVDMEHRKIITYRIVGADHFSRGSGHGTHTSASLAGYPDPNDKSVADEVRMYTGMTPMARMAVYDLGRSENIRIPEDLYNILFKPMLSDSDARICSCAWGAPVDASSDPYDIYAQNVDRFIWDNPSFLVLFGAGNWGDADEAYMSIATPSLAKNSIAVGSATSFAAAFEEAGQHPTAGIEITRSVDDPEVISPFMPMQTANFGPAILSIDSVSRFAELATPAGACEALSVDLNGKIAIIDAGEGDCSAVSRVLRCQAAGASLAVFVNHQGTQYDIRASDNDTEAASVTIPVVGVFSMNGNKLLNLTRNGSVALLVPAIQETKLAKYHLGYVSDFSSRGPTIDGRIKPDLLVPGEQIFSALGDQNLHSQVNQCRSRQSAIVGYMGTSMATPIATAAALQVEQYFKKGFYPSGEEISTDSLNVSAALIKAVLLNSGVECAGYVANGAQKDSEALAIEVDPIPSNIQGFGRVQLDRTLRFNDSLPMFNFFISDNSSVRSFESHNYCFNVSSVSTERPMKITLVWSDYPADVQATYLLVNNLDLIVYAFDAEKVWIGNQREAVEDHNSSIAEYDALNNVEQVTITDHSMNGLMTVHVRGISVAHGPQPFALVVTGLFDVLSIDQCSGKLICPNDCSGKGVCRDGICLCHDDAAGIDCSIGAAPIDIFSGVTRKVGIDEWHYFRLDLNQSTLSKLIPFLQLHVQVLGGSSVDLFIKLDGFPTHLSSDAFNSQRKKNPCIALSNKVLRPGSMYIGVYGGCCSPSQFTLLLKANQKASDMCAETRAGVFRGENRSSDGIFGTSLQVVLALSGFVIVFGFIIFMAIKLLKNQSDAIQYEPIDPRLRRHSSVELSEIEVSSGI